MDRFNETLQYLEKQFQSQTQISRYASYIFKATGILIVLIFIAGFIASWIKISIPQIETPNFNSNRYLEGSVKYKSTEGIIFLSPSFFDEQTAKILLTRGLNDLSSIANILSSQLISKTVVVSKNAFFNEMPKTEAILDYKLKQNQKTIDSLNYLLRKRMFLDFTETSLQGVAAQNIQNIQNFKNGLSSIQVTCSTDFLSEGTNFSFYVGQVNSIVLISPDRLVVDCLNSAPILSAEFLSKVGVPSDKVNPTDLQKQSIILQQIVTKAEVLLKQELNREKLRIRKEVSQQRSGYRKDFYAFWYSEVLLALNSIIFLFLLIRFWIIVRQKRLPKKSTDMIYYATNRTSKVFRFIALIIIAIAMIKLIIGFVLSLIDKVDLLPSAILVPFEKPYIFALFDPPATFVSAIITTWFFILISEWIDFISNCYEVLFHKAHEKKINIDDKLSE